MKEIEPALEKMSKQNTVSHPRFGGLCAEEWFLLVEMHYRHHLLQLDRLKKDCCGKLLNLEKEGNYRYAMSRSLTIIITQPR